jgi:CHAT domain-containing protein
MPLNELAVRADALDLMLFDVCDNLQLSPTQHQKAEDRYHAIANVICAANSPFFCWDSSAAGQGTESGFKSSIDHGIIHLAVHAIANETHPDRAALVLLSDPSHDEDGFLEASEIVQLRLHAELVVLSACNTAVGPLEGEEGVATLSRAFLLAGARTVVSTLWSVEDESTLYLMKSFYAELNRGRGTADALATAKRNMVRKFGTNAVPYYWAGFTVEGVSELPTGQ